MTEASPAPAPPRRSRFQFSISSLLELTLLTACILSVIRCLGSSYGWLSAPPLGIVAVLLLRTRWRCAVGALIGAAVLCPIVLSHSDSDPARITATFASFGAAFGAGIHAIILRQRVMGGIFLALLLGFLAAIFIS